MKRQLFKELKVLLAIVFIISLILPFVYSNDTAKSFSGTYQYYLPITITDTSNTTRTNVPALLSINGTTYYAASYINSSGTNTAMTDNSTGADVEYSMGDRTGALIPTLPAGGSVNYKLLLGTSTNQSRFPVITGTGGYITTADNANLENADNITIAGVFDTSASEVGSNVTSKQDSIIMYVDSPGSVTANFTGVEARPDRDDMAGGWVNTAYAYDDNVLTSANTTLTEGTTGNFTIMSFPSGAYVNSLQVYSSATLNNDTIDIDIQSNGTGAVDSILDTTSLSYAQVGGSNAVHISSNIIAVTYYGVSGTDNITGVKTYSVSSSGNMTLIDTATSITADNKTAGCAYIAHVTGDIYVVGYSSGTNPGGIRIGLWTLDIASSGATGGEISTLGLDSSVNWAGIRDMNVRIGHVYGDIYVVGYRMTGDNLVTLKTVSIDSSGNMAAIDSVSTAANNASNFDMVRVENGVGNIFAVGYSYTVGQNAIQTYAISNTGDINIATDTSIFATGTYGGFQSINFVWNNIYVTGWQGGTQGILRTITISSSGDIAASFVDEQNIYAIGLDITTLHLYGNYYLVSFYEGGLGHDRVGSVSINTAGDIAALAASVDLGAGGNFMFPVHVLSGLYVIPRTIANQLVSISVNQGSWADIYSGSHSGGWVSYDVSPLATTTNIRVRYINAVDGGGTKTFSLNEVQVSSRASVTAPVSSGRHKLALAIANTTLTFYVDGVGIDNDTCYGVADTAYDWVWARGKNGTSVLPLVDNITMGVGGSEVIKYAPNSMITGDTLVNRDSGGSYPGTIHWGTNSYLSITYGTPTAIPSVRTDGASNVQPTQATLYGTLMSLGGEPSMFVGFEYGQTTSYGSNTTLEGMNAVGYFAPTTISGLLPNTTYHFRALGLYSDGVVYGEDMSFTTLSGTGASTDINIINVGVYNGYVETNDTLFCVEMNVAYTPYFPTKNPADYFQLQLLATDNSTILGASPIVQWGDRPESIYLSAANSANLTYQAPYIIRVASIVSGFSTNATYTLVPRDWLGNDPAKLDEWAIHAAYRMEITDNTSLYLQSVTDHGIIITEYAGGYFTDGISGISQVRPNLFSVSEHKNRVPSLSSATNYNSGNTTIAGRLGANISNDANTVGAILGLNGQQTLLFMILFAVIGCILLTVSRTGGFGALGAICLSVPVIGSAIYFNIVAIGMFIMFVVVLLFLAVRQFFWKTI